jgi:hypothetical protein
VCYQVTRLRPIKNKSTGERIIVHQNQNTQIVGLKQPYQSPSLVVKGSVAELTQQQAKVFGSSDGFTFMGQAITNAS